MVIAEGAVFQVAAMCSRDEGSGLRGYSGV